MKIFRVNIEKTKELETLVIAKDVNEAKMLTLMCLRKGELDFDGCYEGEDSITGVNQADITNHTLKEIRDYGIIDGQANLIYDATVVEELSEEQKKQQKEEWLKKYHLELNLGGT